MNPGEWITERDVEVLLAAASGPEPEVIRRLRTNPRRIPLRGAPPKTTEGGDGRRLQVYLGPYVECENQKVSKVETNEGCPNCRKSLMVPGNYPPKHHDFCPKCGTARGTYSKSRLVNLVSYEEQAEADVHNDWFVRTAYDLNRKDTDLREIMLPNRALPEGHSQAFHRHEGPAGVFDIPDRGEVLAEFEAKWSKEIATLRKLYGDGRVEVKFGVIAYYS